ncbi:KTSC domain-containing protein [Candidatus Bipolaricaulota bacterium]|nr:KTSC domain-containing protein [Candidatus Bipolaricaulota bacterium]
MKRKSVQSSNLASIGYDSETLLLEIEFNDGSVYQYSGVSEKTYQDLMGASSHGKFFHKHIKENYPTDKIS